MKTVFSVQDLKVGFGHPHLAGNSAEAIRNFQQAIHADPNGIYNKHAPDFILMEIGTFDTETGTITPLLPPRVVCSASDLLN